MIGILVTRPAGSTDRLVAALEALGYRVHAVPTVKTDAVFFDAERLSACDWVVVTSAQGVHALQSMPAGPRFAAVGVKTANALRARGVEPAHVPAVASAASLADTLPDVRGKRVALVRASAAGADLPVRLRDLGALVDEITAYRTVEGPQASAPGVRAALDDPELAAVVFASGSAIRGFIALGGTTNVPAVTIGPRTSATARELGFRVIGEASEQSAEALAAAVAGALPMEEMKNA
ncbi:MAG: uroporphyrinogen-III synthase [Candidatus Dormibacteraceae bacterium]